MKTGQPFAAQEWHIAYDNNGDGVREDHWFDLVFNPLREGDGSVSGVIAVLTEVTVHVLSRRELERVNQELEEFAYVASHDLQEPLRMVNTFTQLLLKRHLNRSDPEVVEYAGFIEKGVSRMQYLIRDLLAYSRAVDRSDLIPALQNETADLNLVWAESQAVMKDLIDQLGAEVSAGPLPVVTGDAAQFGQVFQNLLSNALKYAKRHVKPRVEITAERSADQWILTFSDNGIGFDQQYAKGIFGLFKRLHREGYEGTGLGLAICQRVIQRYGGRIWAESQEGAGSKFFIALPVTARLSDGNESIHKGLLQSGKNV